MAHLRRGNFQAALFKGWYHGRLESLGAVIETLGIPSPSSKSRCMPSSSENVIVRFETCSPSTRNLSGDDELMMMGLPRSGSRVSVYLPCFFSSSKTISGGTKEEPLCWDDVLREACLVSSGSTLSSSRGTSEISDEAENRSCVSASCGRLGAHGLRTDCQEPELVAEKREATATVGLSPSESSSRKDELMEPSSISSMASSANGVRELLVLLSLLIMFVQMWASQTDGLSTKHARLFANVSDVVVQRPDSSVMLTSCLLTHNHRGPSACWKSPR